MDYIEKIKKIMQLLNATQADVARMIGVNRSQITRWLEGTQAFSLRGMQKIDAAYQKALLESSA